MGKISAIVDPTGERETYHYDGQGRLIRKTDRNGVTVELGYNLYGAPLFKKEKDGAQGDFYEYTPEGLLKCAISDGMRYAYDYDEMGRMIRKSASGRTLLALEYDKNGNRVRQTDVTGKLTGFEYDRQGQLLRLTDDGQELAAYTYNLDGTPQAVTHGPIRQEYAYDLDKNLTGLTVRSGDTLLSQTSYAYDGNGNRIRKQALDGTTLYQYDALGQLQRVDYPAYSEELFYDKAGNRTRRLVGDEEELYQYDPRNRLMALTRGGVTAPFQYDNAGNLLQDDKARYSYDAFNRTVKVETFDGNVQVNRYDAEGLRHEMEENGRLVRFIFHKGEAVAEQEENSNVIRLIRGSELIARSSDSESARTYYHYASDEMGSTTHIVDENGNVQNRYAYDAWGKIEVKEEAVPNRFTYYGQQIDPITQQYYLRTRFYNPVIGRFTQEDTYRGDGLNLYAYCANNPVYYIDPSGYYKDGVERAQFQFSEWEPGDSITRPMPDGSYPSWDTIRHRYWRARAQLATDGEFSPQNMGLMRAGYAPKASVLVRDRDTGKYSIKVVTLEIHHNRGGRGTQGFDEPIDLREVWPWEHEQLDPSRHPGYDFISFYSVHSK